MEKSDHTLAKGKLQSTQILEEKWREISIDFITDLPMSSENKDTVLTVVDKATRVAHSSESSEKGLLETITITFKCPLHCLNGTFTLNGILHCP